MIKTIKPLFEIFLSSFMHIYNLLNYTFLYFFQRFCFLVFGVVFFYDFDAEFARFTTGNLALKDISYCREATSHLNLPKGISTFSSRESLE